MEKEATGSDCWPRISPTYSSALSFKPQRRKSPIFFGGPKPKCGRRLANLICRCSSRDKNRRGRDEQPPQFSLGLAKLGPV